MGKGGGEIPFWRVARGDRGCFFARGRFAALWDVAGLRAVVVVVVVTCGLRRVARGSWWRLASVARCGGAATHMQARTLSGMQQRRFHNFNPQSRVPSALRPASSVFSPLTSPMQTLVNYTVACFFGSVRVAHLDIFCKGYVFEPAVRPTGRIIQAPGKTEASYAYSTLLPLFP